MSSSAPCQSETYLMPDGTQTTHACEVCKKPFIAQNKHQRTCGQRLCQSRLYYEGRKQDPARIAKNRARCARWAARKRGCRKRQPWLLGAPPLLGYMPGMGFELFVEPEPRWPIDHRNTRALHGLITGLLGEPHQRWPGWALLPHKRGCRWAVFARNADRVAELAAQRTIEAQLFRRRVTCRLGATWRAKYPVVRKRGHRKLRVDAVTPVVIQSTDRTKHRVEPTNVSLISTLTTELPARLGIEDFERDSLMLKVVSHESRKEVVRLGEKYGSVAGWVGHIIVDTNAVGEFLLRCAANGPGLGGRTAFGFGRVVVQAA